MKKLLYSVEQIDLDILKSNPPKLEINVIGYARTSGWNNADLILRSSRTDISEGKYIFDFVADPPAPGTITGDLLEKKSASYLLDPMPSKLKLILVRAETNELTKDTIPSEIQTNEKSAKRTKT